MKTEVEKLESFSPVVVKITCETQQELDALGSLFNSGPICDAVEKTFLGVSLHDGRGPWWAFELAGADLTRSVEINKRISDHFREARRRRAQDPTALRFEYR